MKYTAYAQGEVNVKSASGVIYHCRFRVPLYHNKQYINYTAKENKSPKMEQQW